MDHTVCQVDTPQPQGVSGLTFGLMQAGRYVPLGERPLLTNTWEVGGGAAEMTNTWEVWGVGQQREAF